MTSARYAVGIDLGTTNSAVAYVDLLASSENRISKVFPIEQDVSLGVRSFQSTLPSAIALAENGEILSVGKSAQETAGRSPDEVVLSAKSWLAHAGIDRESRILPWQSRIISHDKRLSPVDASSAILAHIRSAWNSQMAEFEPSYRLENQAVTITVPASFDESAQRLTLEAARRAGYGDTVRLLEEPQAAFYRWLEKGEAIPKGVLTVLVIDVGGGTTDFSLFDLTWNSGIPAVTRRSVSDHILLGGDNIDRAIAHHIEENLQSTKNERLTPLQFNVLVQQSRNLKERVLNDAREEQETYKISLPRLSSSLFDAPLVAEITSREISGLVLEGFYPTVSSEKRPQRAQGGLREIGLPYARDTRITAHLSEFLKKERVDAVLFNGGSLASEVIRGRLLANIASWQDGDSALILETSEYDLAVARGAARYCAAIAMGSSASIVGGQPRSLYLELYRRRQSELRRGVCIVPKGFSNEAVTLVPGENFSLVTGRLARFQLWQSGTRPTDTIGEIVTLDDLEFRELSPMTTKLDVPSGRTKSSDGTISVVPAVRVLQTGLLELTFQESNSQFEPPLSFTLEFSLRNDRDTPQPSDGNSPNQIDKALLQKAIESIDIFFGKSRTERESTNPKTLIRTLEQVVRSPREKWELPLLRALWPALSRGIGRRGRSQKHEEVWFLLAGWLLRPGYGFPGDDSRISELWKAWSSGLSFPREASCKTQWWIMWRRVAAGLTHAQQADLFDKAYSSISSISTGERGEIIRLLGALERAPKEAKEELGEMLLKEVVKSDSGVDSSVPWALGRIGARIPFYAGIDSVTSPDLVSRWIRLILDKPNLLRPFRKALLLMARCTSERTLNLDQDTVSLIIKKLRPLGVEDSEFDALTIPTEFVEEDVRFWSGDELPSGLKVTPSSV